MASFAATADVRDEPVARDSRRRRRSGRPSRSSPDWSSLPADRLVEWTLIFACLAIPTLFLGGLHPLGKLIYLALVATLAIYQTFAFPRRSDAATGVGALWLFAIGLVAIQIVPLPASLIEAFGDGYAELLPAWNEHGEFGRWTSISLVPHAGKLGLGTLLAHALFFRCVASALREKTDLDRALLLAATLGLLMACLAMAQYFLGNGKYLWIYDYPTRDAQDTAKIPFTNGNHLAHYLALCVGPWIWLLVATARGAFSSGPFGSGTRRRSNFGSSARSEMLVLGGGACLIGVGAALLTFSRGGAAVFVGAALIAVLWYAWRGTIPARIAIGSGVAVALVVGAAFLFAGDRLARELDLDQIASWERLDPDYLRTRLWLADLEAWKRFPLFGSGVGSHREIYPTFYAYWYPKEYRFAESGFVHLLVETGAAGILLALVAIGVVGWRLYVARPPKSSHSSVQKRSKQGKVSEPGFASGSLVRGALAASFVASVFHNLFDFPWFLPGCMSLTLLLAATICRAATLQAGSDEAADQDCSNTSAALPTFLSSPRHLVTLAGVGALLWIALATHLPEVRGAAAWDDYLRIAVRSEGRGMFDVSQGGASDEDVARMIDALQRRLRETPDDHRASVRLAGLCLRRFDAEQIASENAFSLADLRETLERGGFDDGEAKRVWIERVVGPRRKLLAAASTYARRAIGRSPLDGEAYVYLAAAGPFAANEEMDSEKLFDQALASRPYDGTTLLHAAEHAARRGDQEKAIERFHTAYAIVPPTRARIVATLSPMTPPQLLLDEIGVGESVEGCRRLTHSYVAQWRAEDALLAAERWSTLLSNEEAGGEENPLRNWIELADVYEKLQRADRMSDALARAAELAPGEYVVRRRYAFALVALGRFDEAEAELTACLRIRPDDPHVLQQRRLLRDRASAARTAAIRSELPPR